VTQHSTTVNTKTTVAVSANRMQSN